MNISNGVNNPTLGYRLDPGEPGLLRKAKASDSTRAVTSQELRNLNRLRSEAMLEGRTVIKAQIRYSQGIDGSFSSVRAGQTTVISVAGPEPLSGLSEQSTQKPTSEVVSTAIEIPESQNNVPKENSEEAQAVASSNSEKQKLEKTERELQSQINKIENKLTFNKSDENKDVGKLNLEKSQTEQKLRKVRFQKILHQQNKVIGSSSGAYLQSNNSINNISSSIGNSFQSGKNSIPSLGMNVDRSI